MGYSQAQKAENRERLLENASRQLRTGGFGSINVASLMRSAGLTHGGFYGHFDSKDTLLEEALKRALVDGEATARSKSAKEHRGASEIVRGYLSKQHRQHPDEGCAIAALVSDVGRMDDNVRAIMEKHVASFIEKMETSLDGDRAKAEVAVSAMVGAIALSRVVTDEEQADRLLGNVRDFLVSETQTASQEA